MVIAEEKSSFVSVCPLTLYVRLMSQLFAVRAMGMAVSIGLGTSCATLIPTVQTNRPEWRTIHFDVHFDVCGGVGKHQVLMPIA